MTAGWTSRQASLYVEALARHLEDDAPAGFEDFKNSSFVYGVYASSQDLWFYKGVVLPPGLESPTLDDLPDHGDLFEHLAEDLDVLHNDVSQSGDRYVLEDCADYVFAISYELKARHGLVGNELRLALLELLASVRDMDPDEVVDILMSASAAGQCPTRSRRTSWRRSCN